MKGYRRDASSVAFLVAVAAILSGWGAAFTQAGADLIFFGVAVAILAVVVYPSVPRFVIAAHLAGFNLLWLPGLAVAFLVSVAAIVTRQVWRRRHIPPPSQD